MPRQILNRQDLHGYQNRGVEFVTQHLRAALHLDMSLGKLQPVSEPVLTPAGWRTMGDLRPGDHVIGSNGYPTQVLGVYPQTDRRTYRMTLSDGSSTRCGPDHLWSIWSHNDFHRGKPRRVLTTQQLLDSGLRESSGNCKWIVPLVEPVQFLAQDLPIDPYLLGVILGDGTVTSAGAISICSDTEIIEQWEGNSRDHISDGISYKYIPYLKDQLSQLGLTGKRSWEKHVPPEYLLGNPKQRLALLQGLMDTDGSHIVGGGAEFSSTSENLSDGVVYLAQSLGGIARKKGPRITYHQNGPGRPSWRINVKLPSHLCPFRLTRKRDRWESPGSRPVQRRITSIKRVDDEDSVCIKVAAADHLYVTKDFILTHNTTTCLTAIVDLFDQALIRGVLVVAPRRVAETVWIAEGQKWLHARHLRINLLRGSNKDKLVRNLQLPHHIWVINYEALPWLYTKLNQLFLALGRDLPFDMIIFDEVTRIKNSEGARISPWYKRDPNRRNAAYPHGVCMMDYFYRRVGLTGTPAPNGYWDLFGQYLALDDGASLGVSQQVYKEKYFIENQYTGRKEPAEGAREKIRARIAHMTLSMQAKDYINLPPLRLNDIMVDLPPGARQQYDDMENTMFMELDGGSTMEVFNAAAVTAKCRQIANGSVIDVDDKDLTHDVHDHKLEALDDIMEEAAGQNVLCAYIFRADMKRIKARYERKGYVVEYLGPGVSDEDALRIVDQWNQRHVDLLLSHPLCLGPDTEVLTETRGWQRIVDVSVTDRVFDGVEFVTHSGCSFSGHHEVINVFGIEMTPDHLLQVKGQWEKASDVRDREGARREASYQYQGDDRRLRQMLTVRARPQDVGAERGSPQSSGKSVLRTLPRRPVSSSHRNQDLPGLAWHEDSMRWDLSREGPPELQRPRHRVLRTMGVVLEFLRGHAQRLLRRADHRADRRERSLLQGELPMGYEHGATVQQAEQPRPHVPGRDHTPSGAMPPRRDVTRQADRLLEQRTDGRRRRESGESVDVRNWSQGDKRTPVFDLVDCGPRHQFLIRNPEGETFISHNSVGHGLNLQFGGHQLVWFGLDYPLEGYLQTNARLARQGQPSPFVVVHRILARSTIDLVVRAALDAKEGDQQALRDALEHYRALKTTRPTREVTYEDMKLLESAL